MLKPELETFPTCSFCGVRYQLGICCWLGPFAHESATPCEWDTTHNYVYHGSASQLSSKTAMLMFLAVPSLGWPCVSSWQDWPVGRCDCWQTGLLHLYRPKQPAWRDSLWRHTGLTITANIFNYSSKLALCFTKGEHTAVKPNLSAQGHEDTLAVHLYAHLYHIWQCKYCMYNNTKMYFMLSP